MYGDDFSSMTLSINEIDQVRSITFRDATDTDTSAIVGLWHSVFHTHTPAHWAIIRDQLEADPDRRAINVRLMEVEGQLVGAVRHVLKWIRVGSTRLLQADVGYVAVLPQYQGRGIGHELMRDSNHWLKERGVHLGRLGGLVHFYERFGWSRFSSSGYRLPLGDHRGGMKRVGFLDGVFLDDADRQSVRLLDKKKHWRRCVELSNTFHADHSGSQIIDGDVEALHRRRCHESELCRHVFQRAGAEVTAYLFATVPDWSSYDLGCARGCEQDLLCLIKHYLLAAHGTGLQHVNTTWPDDPSLHRLLKRERFPYERVEAWGGLGAIRVRVFDWSLLLKQIQPVLENRLVVASLGCGRLHLNVQLSDPSQAAHCDLAAGDDPGVTSLVLNMKQADFVQLVLGMTPSARLELEGCSAAPHNRRLIDILFPLQSVTSLQ